MRRFLLQPFPGLALWLLVISVPVSAADERNAAQASSSEAAKAVETAKNKDQKIALLNKELTASLGEQLVALPEIKDSDPQAVDQYSRRGDLQMFLGKFAEAEADYQKMVALKPDLDASHWRLGIAMYFAGHPEQAAGQFDRYHSFDNVDRENGIWRYLSHRMAFGKEKAKEQLLKYEKDDRPPFREVYALFEGRLSPDDVLKSIDPGLSDSQRMSRLFYAHLYIGMNSAAEGKKAQALDSLREATLNPWPKQAGFGPNYMWHIGRLQYLKLQ